MQRTDSFSAHINHDICAIDWNDEREREREREREACVLAPRRRSMRHDRRANVHHSSCYNSPNIESTTTNQQERERERERERENVIPFRIERRCRRECAWFRQAPLQRRRAQSPTHANETTSIRHSTQTHTHIYMYTYMHMNIIYIHNTPHTSRAAARVCNRSR
jgi:hypothetical protein